MVEIEKSLSPDKNNWMSMIAVAENRTKPVRFTTFSTRISRNKLRLYSAFAPTSVIAFQISLMQWLGLG